jgi:tetratricopeptide (TPR) repeat protein
MRDFVIHIGRPAGDGAYRVTSRIAGEETPADTVFRLPFDDATLSRALEWMESGLLDSDEVQQFGAALFRSLFTGTLLDCYADLAATGEPVRYRLTIDPAALARVPWELLFDPDRRTFLGREGTIVRSPAAPGSARQVPAEAPVRLLVIDAFPRGAPKVQGALDAQQMARALAPLERRKLLEVGVISGVTAVNLRNALAAAMAGPRQRAFALLHFIGYGYRDPATGRPVLLFQNPDGGPAPVDAQELAAVLRPYAVQLVFLSLCQTPGRTALEVTSGFAPALIDAGVPAVVGMQLTVLDEAAGDLPGVFYEAITDNRPVDAALADACRLAGRTVQGAVGPGVPVCYLQGGPGRVLDVRRPERVQLSRRTAVPWLWQAWRSLSHPVRIVLAVAGAIATIVTFTRVVLLPLTRPPPAMVGDINVAVAEFGEIDDQNRLVHSETAAELSQSVYQALDTELASLSESLAQSGLAIHFEVWPPDKTGLVRGSTEGARADSARKLADHISADVIVYGNLNSEDLQQGFVPEFYVSQRKLDGAEELSGEYAFGSPIQTIGDVETNPVARGELRQRLIGRTRALSQFVIGLSYYAAEQYEAAKRYFQEADATQGWEDRDGKEVLYLLLGHSALMVRDLDQARVYYEKSLAVNPEYARARLGLASVIYKQAKGPGVCAEGYVDANGLREALRGFENALTAHFQPASSNIPMKRTMLVGMAQLCLSQARAEDDWDQAEGAFRQVIADARGEGEETADLAAQAYANLGLVFWQRPAADPETKNANLRSAAEDYREAVALVRRVKSRALYEYMLGQLYAEMQECSSAREAFERAVEINPAEADNYAKTRDAMLQYYCQP